MAHMNRITKMALLTLLVFAPYYLWLFTSLILNTMPPYPWPSVIGLTYIPSAVIILVFVHKALYRKELADSQSSKKPGQTRTGTP